MRLFIVATLANLVGRDLIVVIAPILMVFTLPAVPAVFFNRRFRRLYPTKRSYFWGYYFSVYSLFAGISVGLQLKLGPIVVCTCAAMYGVLGWFFAHRQRWAWITLTVISPIGWIVNPFYLRKRWNEDVVTN